MPFNGEFDNLIPSLEADPEGVANQLKVWATEWLEANCMAMRWWPPVRRSLAEIFNVTPDHPAADIEKACQHFKESPKDLKVAEVVEPGERGEVPFTIVRTPVEVHAFDTTVAPQMAPTFWDWFAMYGIRLLADAIDRRTLTLLGSIKGRLQHEDLSELAAITPDIMRLHATGSLSLPASWLIHDTASKRIRPGPLNSASMGAPVNTFAGDDSNIFGPDLCIVRDEFLGHFVTVADSVIVEPEIISETRVDFMLDFWSGIGIDTTTGKAKAVTFDVGVKQGV